MPHTSRSRPLEARNPALVTAAGELSRQRREHATLAPGEIKYKLAECRQDWQDAFQLVYEAYTAAGFMPANPCRLRVTPWHLLPGTDVFLARHAGQVIYTMATIRDSAEGLPLESVYGAEVRQRRQNGVALAEVSCLAARQGHLPASQMFEVFVRLVSLMFQSARINGVERLVIAIHPRHARFYQLWLGFEQIGQVRAYASVCGQPAVAYEHDFERLDAEPYRLYRRVYGSRFAGPELQRQPMSATDRDYFLPFTVYCRGYVPASAA